MKPSTQGNASASTRRGAPLVVGHDLTVVNRTGAAGTVHTPTA